MNEILIIAIATALTGAFPLLVVGYLVGVKQKRHLINGVDQTKLQNPEGFGRFVGHSISLTGLLFLLFSLLLFVEVIGLIVFVILILVVSFLPLPSLFYAKHKYS